MNFRRAIIHIGPKKTGTSTIQARLSANRAVLGRHGILYPGRHANHGGVLTAMLSDRPHDHPKLRIRMEDPSLSGISPEAVARFRAEVAQPDWSTLILSAEALYDLDDRQIAAFRTWLAGHVAHIDIFVTVRDPIDWAVSAAQQQCKSSGDLEMILAKPEIAHWQAAITRWETCFGGPAIRVLSFEELASHADGLGDAFMAAIGLGHLVPEFAPAPEHVNESLSWEAAAMMAALNQSRPFFIEGQRNPARSGRELSSLLGVVGQRFDLPDAARRRAYDHSRGDVAWLRARFGIDRYDYPPERLGPSSNPSGVSGAFLTNLVERMADMANELLALRNLLTIERLLARGRRDAADRLRRKSHAKFPRDARFAAPPQAGDSPDQTTGSPSARVIAT